MARLEGKVAIVTGGGRGIGEATCLRFVEEGARVVITDVDEANGEKLAERLGNSAFFIKHDVSDEEGWTDVVGQTLSAFGKLNILINNAAITGIGSVESMENADWRLLKSVLMDGVFYGMKYGIRAMRQSGEPGSIVNLSSTAAMRGYAPYFGYAACKGAVRSMTLSAAGHCCREGYPIRVNTVLPGGLRTPMAEDLLAQARRLAERGIAVNLESPSGGSGGEARLYDENATPATTFLNIGEAVDGANLIVFLASDESRFVNGAEHVIDNAFTIMPPRA